MIEDIFCGVFLIENNNMQSPNLLMGIEVEAYSHFKLLVDLALNL